MEKITDSIDQFINKLEIEFELAPGKLASTTSFRDMDDWSSMHALILIALVDTEYDITITGEDLRNSETVKDLYDLVLLRKRS